MHTMHKHSIILLFFCFCLQTTVFAQKTFSSQQLQGTWQYTQMDGKDLPKMNGEINMTFQEDGQLISRVADKQQTADWKFDEDQITLLIKSELGDEKWKIIELTEQKLVFEDQKKHQLSFKKIPTPVNKESNASPTDKAPKELYGQWQVQRIESQDVADENMLMEIKEDGSLKIAVLDKEAAGSWEYNAQNSSLLVRSDQTEVWEILKLQADQLVIRDQNRTLSLIKKQ